jgi:hypothetical protein
MYIAVAVIGGEIGIKTKLSSTQEALCWVFSSWWNARVSDLHNVEEVRAALVEFLGKLLYDKIITQDDVLSIAFEGKAPAGKMMDILGESAMNVMLLGLTQEDTLLEKFAIFEEN